MNDKCCKVALLNIRLPFAEAVDYLTKDNDGTHVAFVRMAEGGGRIEHLFQVIDDSVVRMSGFDRFLDIGDTVPCGHINVADISCKDFYLLHTCGEKKAHLFQPSYFNEHLEEMNEAFRNFAASIPYRMLANIAYMFNTEGMSNVSVDISSMFK